MSPESAVTPLLAGRVAVYRETALSYPEVGGTATGPVSGYYQLQRTRVLGTGRELFARATESLLTWQVFQRSGLRPMTSSPRVAKDEIIVNRLGFGPVAISAPCRVIYVIGEERRAGFAYGTLIGHPECGEEAFTLELADDGAVTFTVTAFSRPASRLARIAGPVGRFIQGVESERYLRALP